MRRLLSRFRVLARRFYRFIRAADTPSVYQDHIPQTPEEEEAADEFDRRQW